MKFDHKTIRIASVFVGLILAVVLLYVGFQVLSGRFSQAADETPRDVVASDMTQNSAKINWATGNDTQGVIEYGTSPTALNFFAPESVSGKSHVMDLTLLSPATAYYFQIRIGDKKYDNGGVPWTFTTKSTGSEGETTTPTPTGKVSPPTPISTIVIPSNPTSAPSATTAPKSCAETDCVKICQQLGKTCGGQDLAKNKCVGKINLSTCTLK